MDARYYKNLVKYAKICLPPNSTLDPRELVAEAYLAVNTTDDKVLKKAISTASYKYRSEAGLYFVSLEKAGRRHTAVQDNTQVCKVCSHEKSLNDFTLYTFEDSPRRYHAATCKVCQSKRSRAAIKKRELTDADYREKNRQAKFERSKKRKRDPEKRREEWAKIKADPVKLEDFYRRQKEGRERKKQSRNGSGV
ncbi:hypothetical protein GO755_30570 [Spirosoma sp. HMF4905]|uniref:Uncharacterized protein n=1 Tax=Spirosoma arboris TaxID=2682092 RepID=A0A7K1SKV9_9BACT|nr:hypothetical protein [Spirosoma arboris]MVM34415.1 hypothetical protein [Spirosoma arboris]